MDHEQQHPHSLTQEIASILRDEGLNGSVAIDGIARRVESAARDRIAADLAAVAAEDDRLLEQGAGSREGTAQLVGAQDAWRAAIHIVRVQP